MPRPHHVRHRPPAVDDRAGRLHRRARRRPRRRARDATRSCSSSPTCTRRSRPRACPTRSSSTASRPSRRWWGCEAPPAAQDRRAAAALPRPRDPDAIALLFATAAALAPPPLAKLAIDEGITPGRRRHARPRRRRLPARRRRLLRGDLRADVPRRLGRPARAAGPAAAALRRTCSRCRSASTRRSQAGVLISRMTNDVQALDQLVTDGVVTLFGSTLTLVGTAVILFVLDAELALITFLVFPVLGIASFVFRIVSADAYRIDAREGRADHRLPAGDAVGRARREVCSRRSRATTRASPSSTRRTAQANMKTVNLNAAYFPGVELLSAVVQAGILLYGGFQAIEGEVTIGVLVAFIAALQNFFDPIQQLSQLYTTYQAGMAALDKIFELLDEQPDLRGRPHRAAAHPRRDPLRGRHLRLRRPNARAERHRPGRSRPGQTVALVGSTGAGKSTFAKLVARFHDPTEGRVTHRRPRPARRHAALAARAAGHRPAGGVPVQRHDRRQHRLRPSGRDATRTSARPRAPSARDAFIEALPDGYDTEVGERGAALSRGAAPARRLRPRADRRPAHPRPRRGDLQRRRAHRVAHRGRPAAAARRAAPRSSSPTACPRSAAPAASSSSTTAASPSRARTTS